jgi:hypothetical protein
VRLLLAAAVAEGAQLTAAPLSEPKRRRMSVDSGARPTPPKRQRLVVADSDDTEGTSPAASGTDRRKSSRAGGASKPAEALRFTTTVTDRNCQAEKARQAKFERTMQSKQLDLGLVAPRDSAPRIEKAVYSNLL